MSRKSYFCFANNLKPVLDVDHCLSQIELRNSLGPCAPYAEMPSYLSAMVMRGSEPTLRKL